MTDTSRELACVTTSMLLNKINFLPANLWYEGEPGVWGMVEEAAAVLCLSGINCFSIVPECLVSAALASALLSCILRITDVGVKAVVRTGDGWKMINTVIMSG